MSNPILRISQHEFRGGERGRAGHRPVRSLLILTKWLYMGDTVVAVPLLAATRRAFPDARITLLTGSAAATVLENCPYVDTLLPYDPHTTHRGMVTYLSLLSSLRWRSRPDLCLVVNRSFRSALIALLSGARIRAGFADKAHRRLLTHPVPRDDYRREVECDLDVLRAVAPEPGGERYDSTPHLWVTDAERERGARLLAERGATGSRLVGVQPGASLAAKQWPSERFAATADALAREEVTIVLLGGKEEQAAAQAMRRAMRSPAVDLTGTTTLRETMGVLTHLSLFLSNDTGVSHIAAALDIPTVTLFGPTPASKWGSTDPGALVLIAPDGDLQRLESDSVVAAARRLLDSTNRRTRHVALAG